MNFETIFAPFAATIDQQVSSGPVEEQDLRDFELRLGKVLPEPYREFLRRFGSGLFFGRHEIIGPSTVFMHDIELVMDMLTVQQELRNAGRLGELQVPIHAVEGQYHILDLSRGDGRVHRIGGGASWTDFGVFLQEVVLPDATAA